MIQEAILPETLNPHRYLGLHVGYIANILADAGVHVRRFGHSGDDVCGHCLFDMTLDGRKVLVDYYDFQDTNLPFTDHCPIFKYGYSRRTAGPMTYPFPGPGVYDWGLFRRAQKAFHYQAKELIVASHGLACSAEAKDRRRRVMGIVQREFPKQAVVNRQGSEWDFWSLVNTALVAVLVPGSADHMATRAYHQYFGLGCCVISTEIQSILPWYAEWVPDRHYIQCRPDYSDVPELIRWCEGHRKDCIQIGNNARARFEQYCAPEVLVEWLEECLKGNQA